MHYINCKSAFRPDDCINCCRYKDDCDGDPEWIEYNGRWLKVEEVEELVLNDIGEQEKKAKYND